MLIIRLSPVAQQDIESILAWSHQHFGESGRLRYEALLVRAVLDLAKNSNRPGTLNRPELFDGALTYHLRSSRDNVSKASERVQKPRHFLLYRLAGDRSLEVVRVLHDSMDLSRHALSEE